MSATQEKVVFILPQKAPDNRSLYAYLSNVKRISDIVINYFVTGNLIYESAVDHGIVFCGNDGNGISKSACQWNVSEWGQQPKEQYVPGSDIRYGFCVSNMRNERLLVFETPLDMLSYVNISYDFDSNKLAMSGFQKEQLQIYLSERPYIKTVGFCPNNTSLEQDALKKADRYCRILGYETEFFFLPDLYQDYNDWLKKIYISRR